MTLERLRMTPLMWLTCLIEDLEETRGNACKTKSADSMG